VSTEVRARLHAVDVVRVLTVALVIAVHAVSLQPGGIGLANGAVLVVAHVSREVFFLLTAFVLAYGHRARRWPDFWRRRYPLVVIPYLAWTLIYFLADGSRSPSVLLGYVTTGTARYHLYFLLVTMQMYLAFPVLRGLVLRTRGRHGWLLFGAAAYQIGCYTAVQRGLTDDPSAFLPAYLGFVVAGLVAAEHAEAFLGWTRTHARWVFAGCAGAIAAGLAVFLLRDLALGTPALTASEVFQPVIVVESVAVAWAFLALGLAWERRGLPWRRRVRTASDASFGVYLAHPLLLQALLAASAATGLTRLAAALPGPLVTALSLVVVVPLLYLTCAALTELVRRTPVSLALTGRARAVPTPRPAPTTDGGLRCERQPA
jgi:peptidoglycan/LPS O-acetylase OafA/YrhL